MIKKSYLRKTAIVTTMIIIAIAIAPLLLLSNYKEAKAITSSNEEVMAAINNPNNIISGSGQGQVQCPTAFVSSSSSSSSGSSSNTFRPTQISFGAYKVGQTITGSFDIRSDVDTRSVSGGTIDIGQMVGNQYTLTGTTRKNFGSSICDGSVGASSSTSSSNTLSPTRIIITGQCGTGSTTILLKADNGAIGSFAGNVDCAFIGSDNNNDNNNSNNPTSTQQYQSNNNNNNYQSSNNDDEYLAYKNSNEYRQGSLAYQQCIDAAAKVGNKLSDYEINNCQRDPNYRH
jgi:hypothetical protein